MNKSLLFLLLIALPGVAFVKSFEHIVWYILVGYLVIVSLITYGFYWYDKRQAEKSGPRIAEKVLHLLEFIGGWPAAYIAQETLRHKTSKRSYRFVYWSIVALYQYLALECLLNWRIAGTLFGK